MASATATFAPSPAASPTAALTLANVLYEVTGQVRLHFFPQTTVQNFLDSGI
jgi:hypothetical protein